jgi:hypothetical protein
MSGGYPEDGGSMFLQTVTNHLQVYMPSQPTRPQSELSLPQEPNISYHFKVFSLIAEISLVLLQPSAVTLCSCTDEDSMNFVFNLLQLLKIISVLFAICMKILMSLLI